MSTNSVVLIGRLTKDPEVRKTQSGLSTCNFTVACDRYSKTEENKADFVNCQAWRSSADYIAMYGHKGDLVSVEGSIQTDSYEDKDTGKTVYTTRVLANRISVLTYKKRDEETDTPTDYTSVRKSEVSQMIKDYQEEDLPF